eukprot:4829568-Alexandrium_andersonii.AAC.1
MPGLEGQIRVAPGAQRQARKQGWQHGHASSAARGADAQRRHPGQQVRPNGGRTQRAGSGCGGSTREILQPAPRGC